VNKCDDDTASWCGRAEIDGEQRASLNVDIGLYRDCFCATDDSNTEVLTLFSSVWFCREILEWVRMYLPLSVSDWIQLDWELTNDIGSCTPESLYRMTKKIAQV